MESKLGWLLSGSVQNESNREDDLITLCQTIKIRPAEESQLDNLLTKFWKISKLPEESDKNDDIIIKFQKTIQFNRATGRYKVRLPGMNLRQWTSNPIALNRRAQEDNAHAAQTTKILGLAWNSTNDMFSLSLEKMIRKSEAITKLT